LLHHLLSPTKPVVLTAAMRPATALGADGPQNLLDAATVARWPGAQGVLVVMAGQVHAGAEVRKWHPYRADALGSGDAGALGVVEAGRLRQFRPWPGSPAAAVVGPMPITMSMPAWQTLPAQPDDWPWVAIVHSHAGADGRMVAALQAAGVRGLVVAGTGNGSVHQALQAALDKAQSAGVPVWRCSRCTQGSLVPAGDAAAGPADSLTPWQARLALQLALLAQG
jgi:L-asparaginase